MLQSETIYKSKTKPSEAGGWGRGRKAELGCRWLQGWWLRRVPVDRLGAEQAGRSEVRRHQRTEPRVVAYVLF